MNSETLPILGDLEVILAAITPAAISRMEAKLEPIQEGHDKPLGVIHREEIKRLYVASKKLHAQAKSSLAKADEADTEEEGKELRMQAERLQALSTLCSRLGIAQLQEDFGHHAHSLGITAGWMAVTCECHDDSDGTPPAIAAILKQIFRPSE